MKEIYILERFDFTKEQMIQLKNLGNIHYFNKANQQEIDNAIKYADVILLDWIDPNYILKHMKSGQFICLPYTGYGWIKELPNAIKRGVLVSNTPNYSTNAVAEHHFSLIMSTIKKIAYFNEFVKKNQKVPFNRNMELRGKTVGIIGLGHIGKQLANYLKPFNVKLLTYNSKPKLIDGITDVSLEVLLKQSDIVCVTCSLNEKTKNMISKAQLELMKTNAILTTTTGGVIDQDALANIIEKKLYGVGIDDCDQQIIPQSLLSNDKVICTYHRAYDTHEAEENRINILYKILKLI